MSTDGTSGVSRPVVRQATASDIGALVRLMTDFYLESGYPLDGQWASSSFRSLMESPSLGCVWLAQQDGMPAGHVVLTLRHTMEYGGLSGYIDDLYVRPQFRRLGAASALLTALFNECRACGCKSIHVEAGESNGPALALYAKFGLQAATDGRLLLSVALPES